MLSIGTQVIVKTSRGNKTATIASNIAGVYMNITDCEDPYFNYKLIDMSDVVKVVYGKVSARRVLEVVKANKKATHTRSIDGVDYQVPFFNSIADEIYSLYESVRRFDNFQLNELDVEQSTLEIRNKIYTLEELVLYK